MRTLCFLLCFCLIPLVALAQEQTEAVPLGHSSISSIIDARGNSPESLLPGLAKHPELKPLFEHGPLPSVTKTYFLKRDGRNILFDSGWGSAMDKKGDTLALLQAQGIKPDDITDIVLTHLDFDHIGGLLHNGAPAFPNATLWVSQPEYDAWSEGKISKRPQAALELARKVMAAYRGHIKTFTFGDEILPGVTAIDARGHTPGHTAYEIREGNDRLYILGDLIHVGKVQFAHPELSSIYDMDPEQAAQSRARILEMIASSGAQAGGMHFEMISPVLKRDDGGFMIREPR
ncbi:MAG: MBL fold metallo-hydrolase [Desulfovibrio sp.]|nr:MBL fold metallo-hydrolase [Desulfovibrio sp.]